MTRMEKVLRAPLEKIREELKPADFKPEPEA